MNEIWINSVFPVLSYLNVLCSNSTICIFSFSTNFLIQKNPTQKRYLLYELISSTFRWIFYWTKKLSQHFILSTKKSHQFPHCCRLSLTEGHIFPMPLYQWYQKQYFLTHASINISHHTERLDNHSSFFSFVVSIDRTHCLININFFL